MALCNERIEIFAAKDLKPSKQKLDEGEYVTVKAYTLEVLKRKIYAGEIEDSKTVSAVLAYGDRFAAGKM